MPTLEAPVIRHARREDVSAILTLIQELAIYENALSSVEATESSLLSSLSFSITPSSSPNPNPNTEPQPEELEPLTPTTPARCLLLFNPVGVPVGMALYFHNYSTWRSRSGIYLEDLYVRESERGKGYGVRLLKELAGLVEKMEGTRLEWSVLKWNKPSIEFYESGKVGAKQMEEWVGMRVDGEALGKLAARGEVGVGRLG